MTLEWLRFALCASCIFVGVFIAFSSVFGVFRFPFSLNSLHAAGTNDTLGILLICLGLIIKAGFTMLSLKLFLIVVFFWLSGPVSTHLISSLEVTTNENLGDHCTLPDDEGGAD